MTHDHIRRGTTTLLAALDVEAGPVIGQCMLRHRPTGFVRSPRLIDRRAPAGLDLHLIFDNHIAHKTEVVKSWLARHPRFHIHFRPTSGSGAASSALSANSTGRSATTSTPATPARSPSGRPRRPTPSSASTSAGDACCGRSARSSSGRRSRSARPARRRTASPSPGSRLRPARGDAPPPCRPALRRRC